MLDADAVKEPIVDARITKILALRTDSIAMTEALDAIGEFYISSKYLCPTFGGISVSVTCVLVA